MLSTCHASIGPGVLAIFTLSKIVSSSKLSTSFASHTHINSPSYVSLVIKQSHNLSNSWWNILIKFAAELGDSSLGKCIHCQGMFVNCQLGTSLVDKYTKCGAVDYARLIFDRIGERNVWTWSAMILGLAQHGFYCTSLGTPPENEGLFYEA